MLENSITRKEFLNAAWMAAGAVALTESLLVGLRFLSPRAVDGEFGGVFNLGHFEQYPKGSVTPVESGRFYLVCLDDGGLLAIYRRCTHLGCAVPYDPALGQFVCPCHGSAFTMDGDVLSAPAAKPLDIFFLSISDEGEILVNTAIQVERDQLISEEIIYP